VVFPGTLLELWRVLSACVAADKIILMQAANTGLTEGSTPNGNDYDRDIVIISTLRLDKLHLLDKGEQVLAFLVQRSILWKKHLSRWDVSRTR
jgi:D-lactate dehydrogenase